MNYDEINFTDDPGRSKANTKRGSKYPKRVENWSKSAHLIMQAATADVTICCLEVETLKRFVDIWKGPRRRIIDAVWRRGLMVIGLKIDSRRLSSLFQ